MSALSPAQAYRVKEKMGSLILKQGDLAPDSGTSPNSTVVNQDLQFINWLRKFAADAVDTSLTNGTSVGLPVGLPMSADLLVPELVTIQVKEPPIFRSIILVSNKRYQLFPRRPVKVTVSQFDSF